MQTFSRVAVFNVGVITLVILCVRLCRNRKRVVSSWRSLSYKIGKLIISLWVIKS